MRCFTTLLACASTASALNLPRSSTSSSQTPLVQDALYDGSVLPMQPNPTPTLTP